MSFCTKCGKELMEGSSFCSACGFPVQGTVAKSETASSESFVVDENKVQMFLASKPDFFPAGTESQIRENLLGFDKARFEVVSSVKFLAPSTMFLISFFFGGLGIDRAVLGQKLGFFKFFTGGGFGLLWLIDIIQVQGKTRDRNYKLFQAICNL